MSYSHDVGMCMNGLCYVQVNDTKASIKFQLKKVLCMGVAVANVSMTESEIRGNIV